MFNMINRFAFLAAFLIALCSGAYSDGMVHIEMYPGQAFALQNEGKQVAAISHYNGTEHMILAVQPGQMEGERAVWIFPIPASPEKADVEIVKNFPLLTGKDIEKEKNDNLFAAMTAMSLSQVYPFGPALIVSQFAVGNSQEGVLDDFSNRTKIHGGYEVYESVTGIGLKTELINVKGEAGFTNYANDKGLRLPPESVKNLGQYIGKDYSFVVTWVTDMKEFKAESVSSERREVPLIGVYVKFPSEKMYFPLKPTSIYGDKVVPASIYILGHVTPEIYPEIKQATSTQYLIGYYNTPVQEPEIAEFFNQRTSIPKLEITKITINSPSSSFKDDLWIAARVPQSVSNKKFYNENALAIGLVIFILASVLASLFSGLVIFRKDNPNPGKFALLGLANLLSFLGLCIASYLLKVDQTFAKAKVHANTKKEFIKPIGVAIAVGLGLPILLVIIIFGLNLPNFSPYTNDIIGYVFSFLFAIVAIVLFMSVPIIISAFPITYAYFNEGKKLAKFFVLFTFSFFVFSFLGLALVSNLV